MAQDPDALAEAISEAENLLDDLKATQEQVDEMISVLEELMTPNPVTGEFSDYQVYLQTGAANLYPGQTFSVDLMVQSSASFGGADITVQFDSGLLAYAGYENMLDGMSRVSAAADQLRIARVGNAVNAQAGCRVVTLKFTVKSTIEEGAQQTALTVAEAQVLPNGVTGASYPPAKPGAVVNVTLHNLTVTFQAGENTAMAAAKAYVKYGAAGLWADAAYTQAFIMPVPVPANGYALAGKLWSDGSAVYNENDIKALAFSENAVFTAVAERALAISFISFDEYRAAPQGYKLMLVALTSEKANGLTYYYDGQQMFWAGKYNNGAGCYAFFVKDAVSAESALSKITSAAGQDIVIKYDGNVTGGGKAGLIDVTRVWDLYTMHEVWLAEPAAQYFQMRLEADLNGDGRVDMQDVQEIFSNVYGI
jgi:hypothetical protein